MIASSRTRKAVLRQRRRDNQPLSARARLVKAGLDEANAKRYAGAFSRGATPVAVRVRKLALPGFTKRVPVKLYDRDAFAARLAVYRPAARDVAALFDTLAA